MEIEEDLMSVELRFEDLVTLALPDIRTIMHEDKYRGSRDHFCWA